MRKKSTFLFMYFYSVHELGNNIFNKKKQKIVCQ